VYYPLAHGVHINDPFAFVNEFFGHLSHDDSPVALLYVPGSHLVHASLAETPPVLVPYVPAEHSLHFVFSTKSFYVPALHFLQLLCPVLSCYVPLSQSVGSGDPLFVHLLPLGHFIQSFFSSDPSDGI